MILAGQWVAPFLPVQYSPPQARAITGRSRPHGPQGTLPDILSGGNQFRRAKPGQVLLALHCCRPPQRLGEQPRVAIRVLPTIGHGSWAFMRGGPRPAPWTTKVNPSTQRTEEGDEIRGQRFRLFQRGEVAAALELAPALHVGEAAFDAAARRVRQELLREARDGRGGEADCHLYYRRAQALAGYPGSLASWKHRLVGLLQQRAAAWVH